MVNGTANRNELKLVRLAASVERNSEHPLAEAVVRYAKYQEVELAQVQNFEAIAGSGVQGSVSDRLVQIGTQRWLQEQGIDTQPLQQYNYLAVDGLSLPLIGLAALLTCLALTFSAPESQCPRTHAFPFLLMETGLIGLFSCQDLLLSLRETVDDIAAGN